MRLRIWPVALAVALVLLGGWGYREYRARQRMENFLATRYQQAFYDLTDHVENVQVMLGKGMVAGTPAQHVATLTDVWRYAYAAQSDLSELPVSQPVLMRVYKFLTQVGDYSFTLARKSASGSPLDETSQAKLLTFRNEAARLSSDLHGLAAKASDGSLWWSEIRGSNLNRVLEEGQSAVSKRFSEIDRELTEVPTIIYDGPFSDHLEKRTARGLTGPMLTQVQSKDVGLKFIPPPYRGNYRITGVSLVRGRILSYHLILEPIRGRRGPRIEMDVSRKGGHVVWMLNSRSAIRTKLTTADAAARAQAFLKERGFPNMVPTYITQNDNSVVIPFVYKQGDVLVYSDMIKVTVALDNGEIVGYEASNYLMAHHTRKLPKPKLTLSEAQEKLNPNLKVNSSNMALIPLENPDKEVLTYEFRGMMAGEEYIVFVNALNGDEERILRVVHTAEGSTTM